MLQTVESLICQGMCSTLGIFSTLEDIIQYTGDIIEYIGGYHGYSLFTILLPKVVSFKHATQIPAREVLPVKAINMHVLLYYLETRKDFSQGVVFA